MLKKRRLSVRQQKLPNFSLGATGETRATTYLISHNYRILERNIRLGTREIDIIATDPVTLEIVFVEVKTRSSDQFGSPSVAVTRKKLNSLRQVAREYVRTRHNRTDFRFDIITVLPNAIDHYQNITWNF